MLFIIASILNYPNKLSKQELLNMDSYLTRMKYILAHIEMELQRVEKSKKKIEAFNELN